MSLSMRSAMSRKRSPAGVSSLPVVSRRNSFVRSASSSAAMRRETVAWLSSRRLAAPRIWPARATARKMRTSSQFMAMALEWPALRSFAPPSVLPAISPARGEIGRSSAAFSLRRWILAKATMRAANLPPCGGDVRQDRGGCEGAQPLSLSGNLQMPSFAAINAHPVVVVYFLHNGCVLPRVAFAPAKALNASSQTQGEKP